EPDQRCFDSVDDPTLLSDEVLALAVGPLAIFVHNCRDCDHLAVITLAAQPAKKGAFEQLGIEPVGLGTPVLPRYGYARCMNDMDLDVAGPEPARQPAAVTASLESDSDPFDHVSCLLGFLSPSMLQLKQFALVGRELLQRLALDARHDAGNEPALPAHLDDGNQRAMRFEGVRHRLRSFNFCMGCSIDSHQRQWMQYPRRCPIASLLAGLSPPGMGASLAAPAPPLQAAPKAAFQ